MHPSNQEQVNGPITKKIKTLTFFLIWFSFTHTLCNLEQKSFRLTLEGCMSPVLWELTLKVPIGYRDNKVNYWKWKISLILFQEAHLGIWKTQSHLKVESVNSISCKMIKRKKTFFSDWALIKLQIKNSDSELAASTVNVAS